MGSWSPESAVCKRTGWARAGRRARLLRVPCGLLTDLRYDFAQRRLRRSLCPTSRIAVCIHLFYEDNLCLFADRLRLLRDVDHDLFITIPWTERALFPAVRTTFPHAYVLAVPNHGRGTLPFTKVAQVLVAEGYEVVLKLHCKKGAGVSPEGSFLRVVLERLLPSSPDAIHAIVAEVSSGQTALVGASEVYLPMSVSLTPNRARIEGIIGALVGPEVAAAVVENPDRYGFFAGSMFWARLDALKPLLGFRAMDFEPELGQRDGTIAHALERAYSLLPRLQGLQVAESTAEGIRPRAAESDGAAWWQ